MYAIHLTVHCNFSLLLLFWKNKSRIMKASCCLYVCVPPH
jgi:hypothetical protein